MGNQLTAVVDHQRAERNFLISRETGQHLAADVSAIAQLPLLEPVELTGADQRVVPQNPDKKKKMMFTRQIFSTTALNIDFY